MSSDHVFLPGDFYRMTVGDPIEPAAIVLDEEAFQAAEIAFAFSPGEPGTGQRLRDAISAYLAARI